MNKYRFRIIVEKDEDGIYIVSFPSLKGCYSQGDTVKDALQNIRDAIKLHIESHKSIGEPISFKVLVDKVEVSV